MGVDNYVYVDDVGDDEAGAGATIAAFLLLSLTNTQRCPAGARIVAVAQHTFAFAPTPNTTSSTTAHTPRVLNTSSPPLLQAQQKTQAIESVDRKCYGTSSKSST